MNTLLAEKITEVEVMIDTLMVDEQFSDYELVAFVLELQRSIDLHVTMARELVDQETFAEIESAV